MLPAAAHPPVHVAPRSTRQATLEDWLALPEERRAELIDGRIVYQAMPGPVHGRTRGNTFALLRGPYDRRRDRHAAMPAPDPRDLVTAVPDWICEVLSPSTAHVDMGDKRLGYHRAAVAHYWRVDPINGTLTVLRWNAEGYLVALVAGRGAKARAEPFEAIEIDVSELLGDDGEPEEGREEPPEEPR